MIEELGPQTIDKILELKSPDVIGLDHRTYSTRELKPVIEPHQAALAVMTLTGVRDYLLANPDLIGEATEFGKNAVIHVVSPLEVSVYSPVIKPWFMRDQYVVAKTAPVQFAYNSFMDLEKLIIGLQTYFVPDAAAAELQDFLAHVSDQSEVDYEDDGIAQVVTARTGIKRKGDVTAPQSVILRPYRTFLEVDQPGARFVLRLRKGDNGVAGALFDGDGGNWQLAAVGNIREWLTGALPEGTVILA